MNDEQIKAHTQAWLETIVIAHNLCPFAHKVHSQGSVRYRVCHERSMERCLEALILECVRLDTSPDVVTSLVIYPNAFGAFDDYLDFLAIAESLLIEQGYEGVYQVASFHPDYCFKGSDASDPANYTNRSPYPMLHLLREDSIENALKHYPDAEQIPLRNMQLTRKLGSVKMQRLLAACYQIVPES
ncbi:MAG: DUF1415 domain-containing protein [Gammaproteobacteria bacterium]